MARWRRQTNFATSPLNRLPRPPLRRDLALGLGALRQGACREQSTSGAAGSISRPRMTSASIYAMISVEPCPCLALSEGHSEELQRTLERAFEVELDGDPGRFLG